MLDAIVVGAGPAGLNAALVLGRCRRRTLVCDTGAPRNQAATALWGFLTRDGISPAELLRIGREQLRRYECVELRDVAVMGTERLRDGRFAVTLEDGRRVEARALLLAYGVVDELPQVEGIERFYGESVQHCPYCHGWEVRDQPLAVYGRGDNAAAFALEMTGWSRDLALLTDGPSGISEKQRERLRRMGIALREERVARLEGTGRALERVVFTSGETLARTGLFFSTGQRHHSPFASMLGCEFTEEGSVKTNEHEATNVPGLFVAGDASRREQYAVVSAAEGALAAIAINTMLLKEDIARETR